MKLKELTDLADSTCPELLSLVRQVRPYRIPKQFMAWDVLSLHVAVSTYIFQVRPSGIDRATALHSSRMALWLVQNAPIYCIETSLLRAFERSDVLEANHLFSDLEVAVPTFILMFPRNSVHAPDGGVIDFCVVHLAEVDRPELSAGEAYGLKVACVPHEFKRNLHWSAIDSNGTVWFAGSGLMPDGSIRTTDDMIGRDALSREDREFLQRVRSIILQCLLTLQYMPELFSAPAELKASKQGLSRTQTHGNRGRFMQPRLIGQNYRSAASTAAKGSHASPDTHWRRGHWRRVAVGKGRKERSWAWIKPTIVNALADR